MAGKHTVTGPSRTSPRVKGTATLRVTAASRDDLRLEPPEATIELGGQVTYKAFAVPRTARSWREVTGQTVFSIAPGQPSRSCEGSTRTPATAGSTPSPATSGTGRRTVEGSATLRVVDPVVSLALKPTEATTLVGTDQAYTAEGTTAAGRTVNVTDQTGFTITEPGKCSQAPRQGQLHRQRDRRLHRHRHPHPEGPRRPHGHGHPYGSAWAHDLDNDDYQWVDDHQWVDDYQWVDDTSGSTTTGRRRPPPLRRSR